MKINSKIACLFIITVATIIVSYASFKMHNKVPLIPRTVLFGNPEKSYPSLSPDGTKLAYCAPYEGVMNIWVKTIGKEDDKILTREKKQGIRQFNWAPNGQQLLYVRDNDGDENYQIFAVDSITGDIKNYTLFPQVKAKILKIDPDYSDEILVAINKENPKFFDVYHLDLSTEVLTLIAKNPGTFIDWVAGSNLQVLGGLQTNSDGSQDLFIRNSNNDEWRKLLSVAFEDTLVDEMYSGLLGFSKDNNYLFLNTSLGQNTRCLQRVDVKTGERSVLAQDQEFDVDYVTFDAITLEPEIVCWNKDRYEYKVLNSALEKDFEHMLSISAGDLAAIRKTKDGKKVLLGFEFANKSVEYYVYDFCTQDVTFLFYQRPELNKYQLAPMEPISFIARDGLKIHGYLTCPLKVKKENLPLVLYVHGGPFYRDSWEYNPVVQLLANRGCACLQINFRGSSGYGKAFLAAGNGEWGGKMQDDLVDGVQWAIEQGIADPKKMAIFGGSYGGYAVLVGATCTPDLFCCAIDMCGPSNLKTVLQTLPPYWSLAQWEKYIGKLSDEEFLKSRSPLFKIDQIKIPILIAHGANDVRVKQAESEQIVAAMKEKGIDYEYLLFPDEGHGFVRPENRLKFYAHVEQFLAKHLGTRFER
jgi:dipeptidyl aminopeptidase/acylaminoacyl peptidase